MRLVTFLLASACSLAATPALAGEPAAKDAAAKPAAPAAKTFSTGVAKGRDLLDSAISASTLDEADGPKLGIPSVVGIIGNLPGIRTETSGTDGFGAMTVRGLPLSADGSKFLQVQEDGLPVLEFGDIHFANFDQFVRTDLSLSQIQAIRGGSASTFASNSPGGVVNLISKTGETAGGAVLYTGGLDHDLNRVDFNYGAPLGGGWRFNVGGFYRAGEGPRTLGYTGFKGGQIKFNVTRTFANGFVRVYGKWLDDRQPNYGLYPVLVSGTNEKPVIASIPGTDVLRDTLNTRYVTDLAGLDRRNAVTRYSTRDGLRGKSKAIGFEAQIELGGWTINDKFRFAANSGTYNEAIGMVTAPAGVLPFIINAPTASYAWASGPDAGQAIANPATIGGNGLLTYSIRINADLANLDTTINDLRASKVWPVGGGKLTTTAGLYASFQNIGMLWNFTNTVESLAGGAQGAFVNLIGPGGAPQTQNGIHAYGFGFAVPVGAYHNWYDVRYRVLAPYASANFQIGKLAIGGSLRADRGRVTGQVFASGLGGGRVGQGSVDINGDGRIVAPETRTAVLPLTQPGKVGYSYDYLSYSAGVNYRLAQSASVFARYSRGARAAAERVLGGVSQNAATGQLVDPAIAYAPVKQAEIGLKLRRENFGLYITGFWASTAERNMQIGADANGQVIVIPVNRTYSAKGVELEGEVHHGPFSLTVGATYAKAKIDKDANDPTLAGRTPRHQPSLFFQARPQFESGRFTIGANLNGTTSSFAQDAGALRQPGYVIVSPFLFVRPLPRLELGVRAWNVFDKLAIVQLSGAVIPPGGVLNAQVLNGRTVSASVRYNF